MNRPLLACTIIGLWLICLAPTMPTQVQASTPVVQTDTAKAVQAPPASVDLGPSVGLSYTFPALLADSAAAYSWGYMGVAVDGGSMTDSHLTTLNTLPFRYYFDYYDAATSYTWVAMDVVTVFQGLTGVGTYGTQHSLTVTYSGITTFTWNITTWFYFIPTSAWVQQDCHVGTPAGPGGTYTLTDTPNLTYTSSYVDATGAFRVKVRGWAQIVAAGGGFILRNRMEAVQPKTTRTAMTETRRPSYDALTGGTVLYTLGFMAPESMTAVTVTYPTAWDWQSLQPNANVAETSGQIVITNTDQDTVYSASFTAPVLATANWREYGSDSFESGETLSSLASSTYPIDSQSNEYTIVMDGAVSKHVTDTGYICFWDPKYGLLPAGRYQLVFSIYPTTAFDLQFYYWYGTWITNLTTGTMTANKWQTFRFTFQVTATTGRSWELIKASSASRQFYFDGLFVYNSSVSTGSTITGTCRHIHPNGHASAGSFQFQYNCTTWYTTNTTKTTNPDGTWSISTSGWSLAAGTQTVATWNPNAFSQYTKDSLTYPFAAPSDWTLQGSFSFNDVYGWAFVSSNYAASYTLYEDDASKASGSVAKGGDNIRWTLQTTTGNVSVGIAFTVSGYTGTKWLNTSYTIDLNPLALVTFGCEVGQEEVRLWLVTSWRNCTITITDRHDESGTVHTMVTGAAESVGSWTYPTTHERGNHTVTVTMDGGAATLTRTSVYWWDWPIDIPADAPFPPSVLVGVGFTLALQWGLILILVVGLLALNRRVGGVKQLLREATGYDERPRPRRRRLTPEEQYERPAREYDRITEEANRR